MNFSASYLTQLNILESSAAIMNSVLNRIRSKRSSKIQNLMNPNLLKDEIGSRNGIGCIIDALVIRNNELRLSLKFRGERGKVIRLKGIPSCVRKTLCSFKMLWNYGSRSHNLNYQKQMLLECKDFSILCSLFSVICKLPWMMGRCRITKRRLMQQR